MNTDHSDDDLDHQLREAVAALNPAERELWESMQKFIGSQEAAGVPRKRATTMVRNLLRRVSDIKAKERRKSFKVVE